MRTVDLIARVYRDLRSRVRRRAGAVSARPFQQLRALKLIGDGDLSTQAQLADRLGVDPPAASRLVERLVAEGLLQRRPGSDRRCVRLAVTRAARRDVALTERVIDEVEAELRQRLTAAEWRTLRALLAKLDAGLEPGG